MKRPLIVSALVLVVAFPFVLASPPSSSVTTDPEISAIVGNIDANRIFNTAQTLQNLGHGNRAPTSPNPATASQLRATFFSTNTNRYQDSR
jgi:hypothetical protein